VFRSHHAGDGSRGRTAFHGFVVTSVCRARGGSSSSSGIGGQVGTRRQRIFTVSDMIRCARGREKVRAVVEAGACTKCSSRISISRQFPKQYIQNRQRRKKEEEQTTKKKEVQAHDVCVRSGCPTRGEFNGANCIQYASIAQALPMTEPVCTNERTNERTNEKMNEKMNERTNERTNQQTRPRFGVST
jgi:hypothetical protein